MPFPITFAEKSNNYGFVSSMINFAGNTGYVAVNCSGLMVISALALKAFGYSTALTTTLGTLVVIAAITFAAGIIAVISAFAAAKLLKRCSGT